MKIWYLPLEIVESRYTAQLCGIWMPNGFKQFMDSNDELITIEGESVDTQIKVGAVLDATGRGIYSLTQISNLLKRIRNDEIKDGDVIFIQDYWTPGIEAIQYALDLYNINVRFYTMCHAQSVDKYDFTYSMRYWMRHIELGYDKMFMSGGIFVGSTIHKKQLREAGFQAPIHVVSLPFYDNEVENRIKGFPKNIENAIVFSSRLDAEKQPLFMLKVAKEFLKNYPNWKFYVTTSGKEIRSNVSGVVTQLRIFSNENERFIIKEGLSKNEYYKTLCKSKIQLNTSLQDYVSWTVIESTLCECDICFPNFRSFPEFIPKDRMYEPWKLESVMDVLNNCVKNPRNHLWIPKISNAGRLKECEIMCNGIDKEFNVWKQISEYKENQC